MKFLITTLLSIVMANSIYAQNKNEDLKVLVAYFSWSGNTREIANQIKELTNADIFEIETVKPYSTNYNKCVEEEIGRASCRERVLRLV